MVVVVVVVVLVVFVRARWTQLPVDLILHGYGGDPLPKWLFFFGVTSTSQEKDMAVVR